MIHHPSKCWNIRLLHRLFTPSSARLISEIELPTIASTEDKRIWPFTQSGHYSTKTGYFIALKHQQHDICSMTDDQMRFCRTLWHLNIMPKWKLFIWKMWQNSLALSANLLRRNLTTNGACCICLNDTEDNGHLFRTCPLAQEVWELDLGFSAGDQQHLPFREWLSGQIMHFVAQEGLKGPLLPRFIGALWAIWRSRNAQIFNNVRASLDEFKTLFDLGLQDHALFAAQAMPTRPTEPSAGVPPDFHLVSFGHFHQPSLDVLIRCDGVWDKDSHLATAA